MQKCIAKHLTKWTRSEPCSCGVWCNQIQMNYEFAIAMTTLQRWLYVESSLTLKNNSFVCKASKDEVLNRLAALIVAFNVDWGDVCVTFDLKVHGSFLDNFSSSKHVVEMTTYKPCHEHHPFKILVAWWIYLKICLPCAVCEIKIIKIQHKLWQLYADKWKLDQLIVAHIRAYVYVHQKYL